MKPEHRVRVMELAANRGEKGFSAVVAEALDMYLDAEKHRATAVRKALRLKGSLSHVEGNALRERTREIRENWR
jgi:hypothetical protein